MTDFACLKQIISDGRWFIARDMNCDGVFTISDVGLWLKWTFFLPGDGLLWAVMQLSEVAIFLELTPNAYSGWFPGVVSAIAWLVALGIWAAIAEIFD